MILIVVSEVARAYLELLDLDAQVAIADTQVSIRQQSLELARARFKGGLTSELDVSQGENALAIAEGTRVPDAPPADPEGERAQRPAGSPAGQPPPRAFR